MFLIYIYLELLNTQTKFFHGIIFLLHILKMTVNAMTTSFPMTKCSHSNTLCSSQLFFCFFFYQHLCFFLLSLFVLTSLCFFFLCYFLQFFNCAFYIHVSTNSKISKKHITSFSKQKQLSTITLFIFILEFLACFIFFWHACHLLINALSLKL